MMSSSPIWCVDISQTTNISYGWVIGSCSDISNNWSMVILRQSQSVNCVFTTPLMLIKCFLHLASPVLGAYELTQTCLLSDQVHIQDGKRVQFMCSLLIRCFVRRTWPGQVMYIHIMTGLGTYSVRQVDQAYAQAYNDLIMKKFRQADECKLCFQHPFVFLSKHIGLGACIVILDGLDSDH